MEKFTVDLDKVLDEFEFNEEQAIRHALQHFKREDLPATKYQKPHFKPINIADADFKPCIETTMSLSSFHHKLSQEQESVEEPEAASLDHEVIDGSEPPDLGNLVDVTVLNNHHDSESEGPPRGDVEVAPVVDRVVAPVVAPVTAPAETPGAAPTIAPAAAPTVAPVATPEDASIVTQKEKKKETVAVMEEENFKDRKKETEEKVIVSCALDTKIVEHEEVKPSEKLQEQEKEKEAEPEIAQEPVSTEIRVVESNVHEKEVEKLPSLTETSQEEPTDRTESDRLETLDLVEDKEEAKENKESHPEVEITDRSTEKSEQTPVEELEIKKEEIKPIQFENRLDITDEELQKCLEELEEEEEEEKRKAEAGKPPRPDFLNIDTGIAPGSPGATPLPKNLEGREEVRTESDVTDENTEDPEKTAETTEEGENLSGASTDPPLTIGERRLGKVSPFWMPDHLASSCMECDTKFTVIKRRHHCRACGRILCSKCCGMKASLEYLQNQEQRVCETCFRTLAKVMIYELQNESEGESSPRRRPNPNNPMEYCSTVPPPLQVSSGSSQSPPSVMVPVGVLKREGSSKVKETPKQVIFSDGIRPGGDLTELDGSGDHRNTFRKPGRAGKRVGTPPAGNAALSPSILLPAVDPVSHSFVIEKGVPPICVVNKGETVYEENWTLAKVMERLKDPEAPPLQFAVNSNLLAVVKIIKLDCCMGETCWMIRSKGMGCVGQDEIVVLLTVNDEKDDDLPKDVFRQFHYIYKEASKGNTVNELGYWCVKESTFLDSKQHGGFLFIRPTFQCLNRIELPPPPFLVGILIHRSEIPWARVFPFRLMLRLGAEFRYYPCPLVSVRFREPVYYEIGHTIINLLADFRNLSYTIPSVRGLRIHMEANQTSILIPRNRYDQVIRALNNSNDPVLALAGNFSPEADAHLVCMQSKGNEVTYSTHAININDKPRKVTGASFVVLNGALKTTSGVAAKSSIVEDGLMVQVPSETMTALRAKLRNMEDWSVRCGPIEGRNAEEVVRIVWCEDDKNFNVGVKSVIDNMPLDGVPSIRVHSGKDYFGCSRFIRWTQVFIIKCEDGATSAKIGDPLEVNKLSESIARATCIALTDLLDMLATSGLTVLAVRVTVDQDNVGYEAGSNGEKLAPIYMNSLDNELIPVLHKAVSLNDSVAVLELIFHIMDQVGV